MGARRPVYSVKEIFLTLQGEGGQAGLPAVFVRFAGCNLWSGLERDRAAAVCKFCDTDFIGTNGTGGGKFTAAEDLAREIKSHWPKNMDGDMWAVMTGGEPLLQLDKKLIAACHAMGIKIAVETNGTIAAPKNIDWLCVSPKAGAEIIQTSGHELKLVYPQTENSPQDFEHMDFGIFSLQPRDERFMTSEGESPFLGSPHQNAAIEFCLTRPKWRLSLQTHKWMNIP